MVLFIVALAAAVALSTAPAQAVSCCGLTLTSSQNPSVVGDTVTFNASASVDCADSALVRFYVDDQPPVSMAMPGDSSGNMHSVTYSVAFSSAGDHSVSVVLTAATNMANCADYASLTQVVNAQAPPPPPPPPPPAESPSPPEVGQASPAESPSPTVTPSSTAAQTTHASPTRPSSSGMAQLRIIGAAAALLVTSVIGYALVSHRLHQ